MPGIKFSELKQKKNDELIKQLEELNKEKFNLRFQASNGQLSILTQVTVGENEGIESALRRFKRQVSKAGIFGELKRLRHHETPVEKYKRKLQQRRRSRRR
jgi:small subunit ribosomal protein S21